MRLMPALRPVDAWLLPWDYALDTIDAAVRQARREAGEPPPSKTERRQMSDGRSLPPGITKMLGLFGM